MDNDYIVKELEDITLQLSQLSDKVKKLYEHATLAGQQQSDIEINLIKPACSFDPSGVVM